MSTSSGTLSQSGMLSSTLARAARGLERRLRRGGSTNAHFTDRFATVETFEWRPSGGAINFGDHLATVVVARMLAQAGMLPGEQVRVPHRLFSVGSVLHFARTGDTVWGSGVNGKIEAARHAFKALDVRAVRGPHTARFLKERGIEVPSVFGDPALLLPYLFPDRFKHQAMHDAVFVPNLHELDHKTVLPRISPLLGWNRVVEEILKAKFVVSSSLHGLVIAETYGIPARYVRLSDAENLFKYEDYVFGTGRSNLTFATSIDSALDMGGMPPISFDHAALSAAFPWDLWA